MLDDNPNPESTNIATASSLRARRLARRKVLGSVVIQEMVSRARLKKISKMAKSPASTDHNMNLARFAQYLADSQHAAFLRKDANTKTTVRVKTEAGRKFDKVIVIQFSGNRRVKEDVRFFVEHQTGDIYGAKSPFAHNATWFFGNIYEYEVWDWTGFHPIPLDLDPLTRISVKAQVEAVGQYGEYQHFEQLTKGKMQRLLKERTRASA